MFIYLSQRHAESLALSSLYKVQHLVRRGQISVAAIRLTGSRHRSSANHSIAQGHHARQSSEVSVWDWKPWREIALAERVSERRIQKAEREREKRRERFLGGGGGGASLLGDYEDTTNSGLEEADVAPPETPGMKIQTWRCRTPRTTSKGRMEPTGKKVHYSDSGSINAEDGTNDDPNSTSSPDSGRISFSNARPSTDGTTSREGLMSISDICISDDPGPPGWTWPTEPRNEIIWHIPVYHNINSPSLTIPPPDRRTGLTMPTTVTASNAGDMFQRIHTISEPSGMGYTLSSSFSGLGPVISPQISPKSHASPNMSSGNDTSTASTDEVSPTLPETIGSLSQQSSVLFKNIFERREKLAAELNDSSSGSTVGVSRRREHLQKVKTVLKSFSLKNIHFPWSSSSEEETQTSAYSSNDPSSSEQSWPLNGNIPPDYGLVPPPTRQKYYSYFDKPAPPTRIHSPHIHPPQSKIARKRVPVADIHSPPHPGTKMVPNTKSPSDTTMQSERISIRHQESDPLTRTEKEYQEILGALNGLKRDIRAGRVNISSMSGESEMRQ